MAVKSNTPGMIVFGMMGTGFNIGLFVSRLIADALQEARNVEELTASSRSSDDGSTG